MTLQWKISFFFNNGPCPGLKLNRRDMTGFYSIPCLLGQQVYKKLLIKIFNIEGIMNKQYVLLTASLSKFMNCDIFFHSALSREQKIRKKSILCNSCYEHQKACLLIQRLQVFCNLYKYKPNTVIIRQRLKDTKGGGTLFTSFETSFDSKQPKLEPKLVSALSVSVVLLTPKQRISVFRLNRNKQLESIFGILQKIQGCFGLFWFVSKQFCCFGCFDICLKHRNKLKQTE